MSPSNFDDLILDDEPNSNVDYLSYRWELEDIRSTRAYINRRRDALGNFIRLDNALWRAWIKNQAQLPCSHASLIEWDRDTDTTWLYGPFKPGRTLTPKSEEIAFPYHDQHPSRSLLKEKRTIWRGNGYSRSAPPGTPSEGFFHDGGSYFQSTKKQRRVRFNEEVKQSQCVPQHFKSPVAWCQPQNRWFSNIYESHHSDRTITPLPSTALKSCEPHRAMVYCPARGAPFLHMDKMDDLDDFDFDFLGDLV